MIDFTPTQLKRESSRAFDSVEKEGWIRIVHRDRPDMVLITEDFLRMAMDEAVNTVLEKLNDN